MPYLTKQRTVNGVVERMCRYCEAWYPLASFVRGSAGSLDGLRPKCKRCYADDYEASYRSHRTRRSA